MAGIGDVIAISQLGYKFAKALKVYIDEVGAAEESINALVFEVERASNHVEGLSQLIERDENTEFLTSVGVSECKRLTEEFKTTILSIRSVLVETSGIENDPERIAAEFLDLSRWRRWRWPLFKKTLAVPRARLGELKWELQLLMVTATAHKLSKMPTTQEVEKQRGDANAKLKTLIRTRNKAASRYRKIREKQTTPAARPRSASPCSMLSTSSTYESSDSSDDDMLQFFLEFLDVRKQNAEHELREYEVYKKEKEREARNKAEREQSLLIMAERMEQETQKQKQKEEARKQALEELEKERVVQEERQRQMADHKNRICTVIKNAGFEEDKVDEVMRKIEEAMPSETQFNPMMFLRSETVMPEETQTSDSTASVSQIITSSRQSETRRRLFPWRNSTLPSIFSDNPGYEAEGTERPVLEAWSLEVPSIRLPLPVPTLLKMAKKQDSKSIVKSFASIPRALKEEFHYLMEDKDTESPQYTWQLVGIEMKKHRTRTGLFSYSEGGTSVMVILQRQDNDASGGPATQRGPQRNGSRANWSSEATTPMERLPSILKKPSAPTVSAKQPDAVSAAEPRVRISSESPEVGYADHPGAHENSDNLDLPEDEASTPGMRSPTFRPSMSRDTYIPPALPASNTRAPHINIYNRFDSDDENIEYDIVRRTRDGQGSHGRDSRPSSRQPHSARFVDDSYLPSRFSPPRRSPTRRRSTERHSRETSGISNYSRSQSRSRPRSIYLDPSMPIIREHNRLEFDDMDPAPAHEYDYAYGPRGRPLRRSSTLDSFDDFHAYPAASRDRGGVPNANVLDLGRGRSARPRRPASRLNSLDQEWRVPDEWSSPANNRQQYGRDGGLFGRTERSVPRNLVRSDSWALDDEIYGPPPPPAPVDPHLDHLRARNTPRRGRSSSYDIMFPPPRVFVGDWPGDRPVSPSGPPPPPTPFSRAPSRPAHDAADEMALVLRRTFADEELARLKKKVKKHAYRRSSVRKDSKDKESGDDPQSKMEKRSARKGNKAASWEYDEGENAEQEVLDKYQSMFNADYEPPAAGSGDRATKKSNGYADRTEHSTNGVINITGEGEKAFFTAEPEDMV